MTLWSRLGIGLGLSKQVARYTRLGGIAFLLALARAAR
ncbi:UNVERIFIED_ORG: hypothetical protein J2W85_003943 [Ensifer adhaerens]|jgi:hypothetical protein|nr:hypothetical protein [Ensifer adhaerens]